MISHFHISLNVHNLSLPQVSVVLHSTQFNVACRGTCPLIDFSFIFSSLLVSLSLSPFFSPFFPSLSLFSTFAMTLPLCCTLINQVWRGLFLTPPLINKSLIPIGQWVSQILCFFVELILKPSPERTDVASERGKVTPSYFYIFF